MWEDFSCKDYKSYTVQRGQTEDTGSSHDEEEKKTSSKENMPKAE